MNELKPREPADRVPLTYTQMSLWNLYRLYEKRCANEIVTTTRLCGPLDVNVLRRSVSAVVARHEALRTRIVIAEGEPTQEILALGDVDLEIDDVTALPTSAREIAIPYLTRQLALAPRYVEVGPLFEFRLLRTDWNDHTLIVLLDHLISDMFSMRLLLRDLQAIYQRNFSRPAPEMPKVEIQFADYAVWQRRSHDSWMERHGAYLHERLMGCKRLRFPRGSTSTDRQKKGLGTAPFIIQRELKMGLRRWCRAHRTTLVMGVFVAYISLVLRWCDASDAIIWYSTDSRGSRKIQNTVGFFASKIYLRIELSDNDHFLDLLDQVTKECCNAYAHADFGYLESIEPKPEFTMGPGFNWIPGATLSVPPESSNSEGTISFSEFHLHTPMVVEIPEWDDEPLVTLYDTDDEIAGTIVFPMHEFSAGNMELFGRNFLALLAKLISEPMERVKSWALLK